jgi:hypothetical protein
VDMVGAWVVSDPASRRGAVQRVIPNPYPTILLQAPCAGHAPVNVLYPTDEELEERAATEVNAWAALALTLAQALTHALTQALTLCNPMDPRTLTLTLTR